MASVATLAELRDAKRINRDLPNNSHLWIVHAKAKGVGPKEAEVRQVMRQLGYRDTKVSGVSLLRTAVRYSRAQD